MRRSGNFNLGSELLGNSSNDESPEDVSHDNQQRCAVAQCCRVSIRLQQKVNLVGHHRGMHPFRLRVQPDSCSAGFLLCSQLSNATGSHVPARSRTAAALRGPAHLLGLEFCTTPAVPILEEVLAAFVCGTSVSPQRRIDTTSEDTR